MTTIEAVVFGMDGVIVDSEPVWQSVRVDLVSDLGGVWTAADGDECRGRPPDVWSRLIANRVQEAMTPDEVFAEVLNRMVSAYEQQLPLFPGAVEAISSIATRYTVAVASGSPNELIDTVLRESGLDSICAAVGYGDQVEEGKPAPDIYLEVLRRLDVQPQYALGVEDSIAGLTSVQTAGMHSVAVVTPECPLPEDVVRQTAIQISQLAHLTAQMIEAIVPQS